MGKMKLAIGVSIFATLYAFGWLFWKLIGRSVAVAWELIPRAFYDYLVDAWRAEREMRLADAEDAFACAADANPSAE